MKKFITKKFSNFGDIRFNKIEKNKKICQIHRILFVKEVDDFCHFHLDVNFVPQGLSKLKLKACELHHIKRYTIITDKSSSDEFSIKQIDYIVLNPIQVSSEILLKKNTELIKAANSDENDIKMLLIHLNEILDASIGGGGVTSLCVFFEKNNNQNVAELHHLKNLIVMNMEICSKGIDKLIADGDSKFKPLIDHLSKNFKLIQQQIEKDITKFEESTK